jgi:hypothetical protein
VVRVAKWLLVIALSVSIGAHWAILQTAAWCGMAITYSQNSSICERLSKTFDGKHPCKMCKMVSEGTKSEKQDATQLKVTKPDTSNTFELIVLFIPPLKQGFFGYLNIYSTRSEEPSTPPPNPSLV